MERINFNKEIENDSNLILGLFTDFNKTVSSFEKNKEISILDFGSGDLSMSSALIRGLDLKNKIQYICCDEIYGKGTEGKDFLNKSIESKRIFPLKENFDVCFLPEVEGLDTSIDVLFSSFCFHHYLEKKTMKYLAAELKSINPKKIIISEYNLPKNITDEDFRNIFGKSIQEKKRVSIK